MFGWRVALWAMLVVLTLVFLFLVRAIVPPFALALVLSAVLEPLARRLQRRGLPWRASVWVIWLGAAILGAGLAIWLVPTAAKQVVTLRDKVEGLSSDIAEQTARDNFFVRWNPRYLVTKDPNFQAIDRFFLTNGPRLAAVGLPTNRRTAMSQYVEPNRQDLTKNFQEFTFRLLTTLRTVSSNLMIYLFVPLLVLFILQDVDRFKERAAAVIPPSIRSETVDLIVDIFNVFVRYLRGMALLIMIYMGLAAVVLTTLGAPYSLLLAVVFGFIYLIPILGGMINALTLFLLTGLSGKTGAWFYDFGSPWAYAAAIAIAYVAVFTVFDTLVPNMVVGKAVNLHPAVSFFVIVAAGALLGPVGMVIAFPAAGAIKVVLDRLLEVTSKPQELGLPAVPLRHRAT